MTTEPYGEIVGQPQDLDRLDPYSETGAIDVPCPGCGAVSGERCTFEAEVYEPGLGLVTRSRPRHLPCIVRITRKGKSDA